MWFGSREKKREVKEHIRPESLITPRSIRKPSTGHTGPKKYIKAQAKKSQAYIMSTSRSLAGPHMDYHVSMSWVSYQPWNSIHPFPRPLHFPGLDIFPPLSSPIPPFLYPLNSSESFLVSRLRSEKKGLFQRKTFIYFSR